MPLRRPDACRLIGIGLLSLVATLATHAPVAADDPSADALSADAAGIEFYERKIRPLLIERCYECHSGDSEILQGGLRLDRHDAMLKGGDSGPAIVAGDPDESLLMQAVRYDGYEMPPEGKLPPGEIALIEEWMRRGAPMPPDRPDDRPASPTSIDFEAGREFWSFQPLRDPVPPAVGAAHWPARPLDAFLLAKLEAAGLSPSPAADRRTLLRRVSFDLTGLPPTPDEVERFLADPSPDAYSRVVDRLLASPHYGERWARHWLDLTRYTDVQASWISSEAQAWLYRDWVVEALNRDLPYDDFVRAQFAADQLPNAQPEDIAALGFLGLSPAYWKELKLDKEVIKGTVAEEWEERIDAIGRTFLGLTIACARCHDHKFDPISTQDYYAMAGVLSNTRIIERPVIPKDEFEAVKKAREQVASLEQQIKTLTAAKPAPADKKQTLDELRRKIATLEETTPHYSSATAFAVDNAALFVEADGPNATKLVYKADEAFDLHVHIRGNPSNQGPLVPRRFLTVLSDGHPRSLTHGSGRLDLAEAIVTDAAPLAARVIVNRVWRHHFGRGLVETTSDFGTQGSPPSHPDLLEHLASQFIAQGWSLKWLHREIVLSAAYRQSSLTDEAVASVATVESVDPRAVDPENRLLSHMNRRRLEIEAWRDAVLVASGRLDQSIGGPPLALDSPGNLRRTIYGQVNRYDLADMLRLFDFPDPLAHSPGRDPTTTPLQQLFVLNSDFLQQQAAALSQRVAAEPSDDPAARIEAIYRWLFGRLPDDEELRLGLAFVASGSTDPADEAALWRQYAQALLGMNEFLFVD